MIYLAIRGDFRHVYGASFLISGLKVASTNIEIDTSVVGY